ncbi:MAG: hypothetical protein M3179_13330 [Actinomycetota bacterium]|nr:hypothetical protein [Actinomycetota bacterium]
MALGFAVVAPDRAAAWAGQISTFAGGNIGRGLGTQLWQSPYAVASAGTRVYIADGRSTVIRVLDAETGMEDIHAGTGEEGFSGDGGPARSAKLGYVGGLTVAPTGELYLSDTTNHRVRKIDLLGNISTVVGTGQTFGPIDDGGPAARAQVVSPAGLAFDALGRLHIAESGGHRIRMVGPLGNITTIAGTGVAASAGDGGLARQSSLHVPQHLVFDNVGRLYIGQEFRVRRIDTAGVITTVAGTGNYGPSGPDGGPATDTVIQSPAGLEIDSRGDLLVSESCRIRRVDSAGTITTVAGRSLCALDGDGGPALTTGLYLPGALHFDTAGALYVTENSTRLRRIDLSGIITTVAGFRGPGSPGDGGPAVDAQLARASGVATDRIGNVYVADSLSIRRIDRDHVITTVAGDTRKGGIVDGDGGPAIDAGISGLAGLAVDVDGTIYFTDPWGVRKIDPSGKITRFAGTVPQEGYGGDGGPALAARFSHPTGIALDGLGNVIVADANNRRVRRIDASGIITTIAGTGVAGSGGDGGPATAAQMSYPGSVAVGRGGDLWIGDGNRLRKVDRAGLITTVAIGAGPFVGSVSLDGNDVPFFTAGSQWAPIVMKATAPGVIVPVAGNGTRGSGGDGGPATAAQLDAGALTLGPEGDLYVGDILNGRIRRVEAAGAPRRDVTATGYNGFGQLGTGVPGDRRLPIIVRGARGSREVAAGGLHSLAARADGSAWAWGWNGFGQLGDGTTIDASAPRKVAGLDRIVAVSAGLYHSLALRDDGTLWAWGWNAYGQLGDGTKTQRTTPVRVPGLTGVRGITAGGLHSVAVLSDGTVRAWGYNAIGQLGDGTTTDRSSPVAVKISGVADVAAGLYHSLSRQTDGGVRAWGWNAVGQLGIGSVTDSPVPVPVPGLPPVKSLACGSWYHSAAVASDGTAWTWGWNDVGQLGDGTTTPNPSPRRVPGVTNVKTVVTGGLHTLAVHNDGAVDGWGWNAFGQLGDGTAADRHAPVRSRLLPATTGAAGPFHSLSAAPG